MLGICRVPTAKRNLKAPPQCWCPRENLARLSNIALRSERMGWKNLQTPVDVLKLLSLSGICCFPWSGEQTVHHV